MSRDRLHPEDWRAATAALQAQGLELLTAVDNTKDGVIDLYLRTQSGTVLRTYVDASDLAPSIVTVWPEAVRFEQEIAEMFGVRFDNDASNMPRLFPQGHPLFHTFPLRKSVLLKSRQETVWPGARDPADSGKSPSRRKALPAGVNPDHQGVAL